METPFDYLTTEINGVSLSGAYKMGKQAGIKEVVDWIEKNKQVIPIFWAENVKCVLDIQAWQFKLEEWGLAT